MARTSKQSDDWAALLAEGLADEFVFPKGALSFEELRVFRRSKGAPFGVGSVHHWVRSLKAAGRIEQIDGTARGDNGRRVRATKYLIKK